MPARPDYPTTLKPTPVIPRRGWQGGLADERHIPRLVPMLGVRPLDTYTAGPLERGGTDCPCGGAIPEGSALYCEGCGRAAPDVEARLVALRVRGLTAMVAAAAKAAKFKPKAG